MTKNASLSSKGQNKEYSQIDQECRFHDLDCLCDTCLSNLKTLSIAKTPSPMITKSTSLKEKASTRNNAHTFLQTNNIQVRPRSCPHFAHCDNSVDINYLQKAQNDLMTTYCDTSENTVWNARENLIQEAGGSQRDVNFNLFPHLEMTIKGSTLDNQEPAQSHQNVCDVSESSSISVLQLDNMMPNPPVWTPLAMKERRVCNPYPDSCHDMGITPAVAYSNITISNSKDNVYIMDGDGYGVARTDLETSETLNNESHVLQQKDSCNTAQTPVDDLLCPNLFPNRSGLFHEFHINTKIGDEPVRFYITGETINIDINSNTTRCDVKNEELNRITICDRFEDEKQIELYHDITINGDSAENEYLASDDTDATNCSELWTLAMGEEADSEMFRFNEESLGCSTDEECMHLDDMPIAETDTDTSGSRSQDSFASRPSNPVAQVLEYGDNEHLIPILRDDKLGVNGKTHYTHYDLNRSYTTGNPGVNSNINFNPHHN